MSTTSSAVCSSLGEWIARCHDFGSNAIVDGLGRDFNIYENSFGNPEFIAISVEISADGISFEDVTASSGVPVSIGGDEGHLDNARSFDLGGSGLAAVRFIRRKS